MNGILTDESSGDLMLRNGGIAIGDNTLQCVEQILVSSRGEYKEFPTVGGECYKLLHGGCSRYWINRVKKMCASMGIKLRRLDYNSLGKISISL